MTLIPNQTVASLRRNAFKVKVEHQRFFTGLSERDNGQLKPEYLIRKEGLKFLPKGGKTTVYVTRISDGTNFIGEAVCSNKDAFNRKIGVAISLGRLEIVA